MHKPEPGLGMKLTKTQNSPEFWDTNRSSNPSQKTKLTAKKWTFRIVDFSIPADHRVKIQEDVKRDKY